MTQVTGTFDVTMTQEPLHAAATGGGLSRVSLAKRYHGALDAAGVGEMFAATGETPGSAGYVAMEMVSGMLDGRRGGFVLQHAGTMDRGVPTLSVTIVPDSGTGELIGLSGHLAIRIEGGRHFYDLDYDFRDPPSA